MKDNYVFILESGRWKWYLDLSRPFYYNGNPSIPYADYRLTGKIRAVEGDVVFNISEVFLNSEDEVTINRNIELARESQKFDSKVEKLLNE